MQHQGGGYICVRDARLGGTPDLLVPLNLETLMRFCLP